MRHLCNVGRNSRGAAGLEAAIVLPLFIFFIIGIVELYQQYRTQGIIDQAAATIAHSVSQQTTLYDNGECTVANDVCVYGAIAKELFLPLAYDNNGKVSIALLVPVAGANDSYVWSLPVQSSGATASAITGWKRSYPEALVVPFTNLPAPRSGDTLIVVDAEYTFQPFVLSGAFWGLFTGNRVLRSRAVARPMYGDLRQLSE